jgi:tellurite resistance protein
LNFDSWLAELKIPREAYRVVMLMPLVYVAWADGKVQSKERATILKIAEEHGLLDHGGREALERWLTIAPTKAQLRADLKLLNELCKSEQRLAREFDGDGVQLLLAWCQDVADAAGGMLGLVSARKEGELAALKTISAELDIRSARHWQSLVS